MHSDEEDIKQNDSFNEELEQEDILQQDLNNSNGCQSKTGKENNQNKICFGVFASISHQFNLKNEKHSQELANTLQSAFRVLSLNKPEMCLITQMILKSYGFKLYKILSQNINDSLLAISELLILNDRDDSFTISVRDIKRLVVYANASLENQIKIDYQKFIKKQEQIMINQQKPYFYSMEEKPKHQILKEMEEETKQTQIEKEMRNLLEIQIMHQVFELFIFEKVQIVSIKNNYLNEEKLHIEIKEILSSLFNKKSNGNANHMLINDQNISKLNLESQSIIRSKAIIQGYNFTQKQFDLMIQIHDNIQKAIPIAIVGKQNTGKSKITRFIAKQVLNKELIIIDPSNIGTHREMFGIYDILSSNQFIIQQQLGEVKCPIFKILQNELYQHQQEQNNNKVLVIDQINTQSMNSEQYQISETFNELLLPYLEISKYQQHSNYNENTMQKFINIQLPNGIIEQLQIGIPVIFELRNLNNFSPRMTASLNIILTEDISLSLDQIIEKGKHDIINIISKINKKLKVENSLNNIISQIMMPIIQELQKQKYLINVDNNSLLKTPQFVLTECFQAMKCYFNCIRNQQNQITEQNIQDICLISIVQSIELQCLSNEGQIAFKQILDSIKVYQSQMKLSNFLNQQFDDSTMNLIELKDYQINNEIILNSQLLKISAFAKILLSKQSICFQGYQGCQKSTIIKYICKTYSNEIANQIINIPTTCFQTYKSLRSILSKNKKDQQIDKPVLIIIDDLQIQDNFNLNILQFMHIIKQNNYKMLNPNSDSYQISLNYRFQLLCSNSSKQLKDKSNKFKFSQINVSFDLDNEYNKDFIQVLIQNKFSQIQPYYSIQYQNVLYKLNKWLKDNKKKLNCSQCIINLHSLHIINNIANNLKSYSIKEHDQLESFMLEINNSLTNRIIYPDVRGIINETVVELLKQELPTQFIKKLKNKSFTQNSTLDNFKQNIKNINSHIVYLVTPGSIIKQSLIKLKENNMYKVFEPYGVKKFNDSQNFIEQINKFIISSIGDDNQNNIIVFDDNILNDLSYIDYIINIIKSIKEVTLNKSLSYFDTFDIISSSHYCNLSLKEQLINKYKELNRGQIYQNSVIGSPASPSSIEVQITDNQLLINVINKISQKVHFVLILQNLQNYQNYCKIYGSKIETFFQINFINKEINQEQIINPIQNSPVSIKNINNQNKNQNHLQTLLEIQNWTSQYCINITYNQQFQKQLKLCQHQFNNHINEHYINESDNQNIFKVQDQNDLIFDTSSLLKISGELNMAIPYQYFLSQQRFQMLNTLFNQIKQIIYKSLISQKNLNQKQYQQYSDLNTIYQSNIQGTSKNENLFSKQQVNAFEILQLLDKKESLLQQIKIKNSIIILKEKEKGSMFQLYEKIRSEIQNIIIEEDKQLSDIINKMKQINNQEYKNLSIAINSQQLNEFENEILYTFAQILQNQLNLNNKQNLNYKAIIDQISILLLKPTDLISKIQSFICSNNQIQEQIIAKYNRIIMNQKQVNTNNEQSGKQIIIVFNKFINEVIRKQNNNKHCIAQQIKLKQIKEQLSYSSSILSLYLKQIEELQEELESIEIKEQELRIELKEILKKIDINELKQMKNSYKLDAMIKMGKKAKQKLDKIKIRMKNLEGDCIIMATSVIFLGPLSFQERLEFRKILAEKLLNQKNIESSEYWQNTQSDQLHSKYFKKVIKNDLGLELKQLTELNHLFVDSLFSEFMFNMIFAPSTFVVCDSVGIYQQYLSEEILEEIKTFRVKTLFGSDYLIEEKIQNIIDNDQKTNNQIIFLNDINNFSKSTLGKCQDSFLLNKLGEIGHNDNNIKRIQNLFFENVDITLPQFVVFQANQIYNLNHSYLGTSTIYDASYVNKNEAWIEIKQTLLKHFLPDNYQQLTFIKVQIQILKEKIIKKKKAFNQMYLKIKNQTLEEKDYQSMQEIRNIFIEIKQMEHQHQQFTQNFHNLINEHPLLASYSNIFVIVSFQQIQFIMIQILYSFIIH